MRVRGPPAHRPCGGRLGAAAWRRPRSARDLALGDVAELLRLGEALQLLKRLVLDLADALAGDVEGAADLVECPRVLAPETVTQLEHAPFSIRKVLQRLAQRLLG